MIFFLIAGTYTPFALLVLDGPLADAVLAVVWIGAVIGAIVETVWIEHPKWVAALVYISLGWVAVIAFPGSGTRWAWPGPFSSRAGGLLYTIGAVVYATQRPNPNPRGLRLPRGLPPARDRRRRRPLRGDRVLRAAGLLGRDILKIGAVVVMVNPELKPDAIEYFFEYSRAVVALVTSERADAFRAAAARAGHAPELLLVGGREWESRLGTAPETWRNFPTHPDDAAIWLFSGGTTGRPKAAVQPHRSYVNTAQCYAAPHPVLHRGRHHAVGAETLLRLRDGLQSLLSLRGRRHQRVVRGPLHRGRALRPDRPASADHPHRRSHDDQSDGEPPGCRSPGLLIASPGHVGRGGPARGAPRAMGPGFRRPAARRPGHRRDVAHLPVQPTGSESVLAPWARWCPASRSRSRTTRATSCPTERSDTSGCGAARGRWGTGSSSTRARPASAVSGS